MPTTASKPEANGMQPASEAEGSGSGGSGLPEESSGTISASGSEFEESDDSEDEDKPEMVDPHTLPPLPKEDHPGYPQENGHYFKEKNIYSC